MKQQTTPTSSSSSLADAVASADSTLAELEAFLRRTDSQAHIRVADDYSSSSSLCFHGSAACASRLGGGAEDELRRELERISNRDSAADSCCDEDWRGQSVVRGQWSSRSSSAVDLFGAASNDGNDEQEDSSVLSDDDDDELPLDRSSFFYYSDDDDDSAASPIGTDVSFDSSSSSSCSSSSFSEETSLGTDNEEEEEEESSFENEEPPSCVPDTPEEEVTTMTVTAAGRTSNSESQKKRTTFNLSIFLFRWTEKLAEVLFGPSERQ